MYSDGEEFVGRSGRRGRGRAGAASGSTGGFGQSGSRAAGLSVGLLQSSGRGGQVGQPGLAPGLSGEPLGASPPRTLSPVRVSGAEPVSELALSSTLRQTARRERASSGAPAPAASASSESDSDRSAKGLNPSAVYFSLPPASSRSAGGRLVRQEPVPEPVTPTLSPLVGYEKGNLTSAPGRLEIFRREGPPSAPHIDPPLYARPGYEGFGSALATTQPPDPAPTRYRVSRDQGGVELSQGERRRSALALALGHWSTWAQESTQRRVREGLLVSSSARNRATCMGRMEGQGGPVGASARTPAHGISDLEASDTREGKEHLVGWSPETPADPDGREVSPSLGGRTSVDGGLKRLGKDHPLSGVMWFQFKDHGLSAEGTYRLEVHQKSVSESEELMQQMREDPYKSLERCKFSAFAINVRRSGEIVRRGMSLQEVMRAVMTAVRVSGSTRKSYKGLRKSGKAPLSSVGPGGSWANRFAPLSSSSEEEPSVGPPKPRNQVSRPSGHSRTVSRSRKPGRAPSAPRPGPTSSDDSSNTSSSPESTGSRNSQDLQELKEALQKESRAREAAAEALMEKLSQQLQESQKAAEERRVSEQRAAEERWAADRLAAEAR
ncbi:hypothetical protein CYMTET_11418 [Cymbomonas tetramitiformis]|uniref:Uncharacterized protein n=1 Tax=Cymbomonas tetramitiformis TaxID=36881 RepID=A0AAE0LDH8_9CHLO|nr:hypothetical protein CYMTET_11418 [Cymbomonas tetramitiformis]